MSGKLSWREELLIRGHAVLQEISCCLDVEGIMMVRPPLVKSACPGR